MDPQTALDSQVASVARGAFAQLWLVHWLRRYPSQKDLATMAHAISPRLLQCILSGAILEDSLEAAVSAECSALVGHRGLGD